MGHKPARSTVIALKIHHVARVSISLILWLMRLAGLTHTVEYGQCGVGAYCLGGCDPQSSFSLQSCVPAPVCKSGKYTFDSMDRITAKSKYLGDASKTDWVMDGQAVPFDGNVLLTMAPDTVGTLLASSTYMWYGNVKAKFKTSRGKGVVTAFILLSDVKDEIDYEFVGVDLKTAQTNYYHQGITNCQCSLMSSL